MSTDHIAPTWPSLYNILKEIQKIEHEDPVQPGAYYLYDANDIYRFTLYWTLIFYTPAYILCGLYAFLNLTFPLQSRVRRFLLLSPSPSRYRAVPTTNTIPLHDLRNDTLPSLEAALHHPASISRAKTKPKERRSRLTFALIVALAFAVCALGGAVLGSAILGYTMAGLFSAAHYNMSTWIPFLLGLVQALIGLLGLWPSIIDII